MNIIELEIGAIDSKIRTLKETSEIENAEEIQRLINRRDELLIMA